MAPHLDTFVEGYPTRVPFWTIVRAVVTLLTLNQYLSLITNRPSINCLKKNNSKNRAQPLLTARVCIRYWYETNKHLNRFKKIMNIARLWYSSDVDLIFLRGQGTNRDFFPLNFSKRKSIKLITLRNDANLFGIILNRAHPSITDATVCDVSCFRIQQHELSLPWKKKTIASMSIYTIRTPLIYTEARGSP